MYFSKKTRISGDRDKISNCILNWSIGDENILNIISLPYNSSYILVKTILRYVYNNKKVLYITEEEYNIDLILNIKKYSKFRNYSYIRDVNMDLENNLIICNHKKASNIKNNFHLVIYDDVNSFPKYSNEEIKQLIMKKFNKSKCIIYSIESIFKNKMDIILPIKEDKKPIIEPRIITTRIDMNRDIPFLIYDYINFSIKFNRKVIIYVPDEIKVKNVFAYINKYPFRKEKNVYYYIKDKSNEKVITNFTKIKKAIIITNEFHYLFSYLTDTDIMVYFADDEKFNYKEFVYLCSKIKGNEGKYRGEVILLAYQETKQMEEAKIITRNFNKEAWETGLLKI
ncbi:hypothetical protein CLOACE_19510 [Clostridium acetireducens DSM 10703]|uniref:Comf operon protein A, DNA transporter ATPase n=1 Tax=Clostridium acetireducens DSM 10703 TaxID=1121290 RepID=A0A1E8EWQ3_9CLOT|nr:hypothetical protein [Clostridium acetireducens]OFI05030.1 hypothetical protein CLOACE_19510 [Clostridium acetireducens DSM 10703]